MILASDSGSLTGPEWGGPGGTFWVPIREYSPEHKSDLSGNIRRSRKVRFAGAEKSDSPEQKSHEEDPSFYNHEYSTPFLPCPKDFKTNSYGKLIIDHVSFSFRDADGYLVTDKVWDGVTDLEDFIDEVFHDHFEDPMDEDVEVDEEATKNHLKEVSSFATEFFVSTIRIC